MKVLAFEPSISISMASEPSARMAFMPRERIVYVGEGAGLSAVHPGHVGIDWQTENSLRGGKSRLKCSAPWTRWLSSPEISISMAFEPSAQMAFMPSEVSADEPSTSMADEPSTSMADEPSESKAVEPSKVPEMIGGEVYVGEGAGLSAVHPGHVGIDWQTENSLHGGRSRLSCSAQVGIDWNIGEVETWTVQGRHSGRRQ